MPVDRRGTEIKVGQTVAYNQSGQVGLGEVVEIVPSRRYGTSGHTFKVKNLDGHGWQPKDGVSKVREPLNLLVITEDLL